MARTNTDPIENLIAEGKIRQASRNVEFTVHESVINFERLYNNLTQNLQLAYDHWEPLTARYSGTMTEITEAIQNDVSSMVTFALWITYNRLRTVAERYAPYVRTSKMNHKAPCSHRMEFPTYLSSTLQSLGPLMIVDAPHDLLLIYTVPPNTANHFGRTAAQMPSERMCNRLLAHLKALNVPCSPIDITPIDGSFASTCKFVMTDDVLGIAGTVHRSHYTNDDVKRFLLMNYPELEESPFEDPSFTVEYVDDKATITALTAIAAPNPIPSGQTATSAGRPCGFIYDVNYFGIKPAVAAQGTTAAKAAGCYVLGRGLTSIGTVYLAQQLTAYEINTIILYHLTH